MGIKIEEMINYLYTERKKYRKNIRWNKTKIHYRMRFINKLFDNKIEDKDYGLW